MDFDLKVDNPIVLSKPNNKSMGGKLLRKPRAPKSLPPMTVTPAPPETTPARPFYENYDFEEREYGSPQHHYRTEVDSPMKSPTPSIVPSLISPPPSESNPVKRMLYRHTIHGSPQSNVTFISRDEKKFVLDPLYREKTSLGTYVDGKSLVKPFKPRGPQMFPARPPRRNPEIYSVDYIDDIRFIKPPAFSLDDFLSEMSEYNRIPLVRMREAVYSRHNYKKITKLLADQVLHPTLQKEVHVNNFTPEGQNVPPAEPRIPQKQLLIEMAAMIKQHVRDLMNTEVKSVIRPLKKYSPNYKDDNGPHTEIILYEDDTSEVTSKSIQYKQDTEMPAVDSIFQSARSRYFQGSGRSRSPFTAQGESMISPSELAILDCLINGGKVLSLKAHFILQLPDISPLVKTVTYINLSFNDFTLFPREILEIKQLEVLKLRNNPLRDLPLDISRLKNLRVLVVSFCLLSSLPLELFSLPKLVHLDISYNKLTFIPNEICNARFLEELNLEGNQLPAMPCGALKLDLQYLNVKNNFMHPLFWKENMKNQPQRLIDMAALVMHDMGLHKYPEKFPESVNSVLSSCTTCDCCNGVLYGPGLRIIRPVSKIHGIKNLPFLFRACSPNCLYVFKTSKETLSEILYGTSEP